MVLFRGPRLLLCGPYYTVTIVLYDTITYKIQVNNLVLCSWHGELPLCWCQAIQYMLNRLHLRFWLASFIWFIWLAYSYSIVQLSPASCVCIIIVCHPSLCHCYTTDEPYLAPVDVDTYCTVYWLIIFIC